jgi:hypothetical protein
MVGLEIAMYMTLVTHPPTQPIGKCDMLMCGPEHLYVTTFSTKTTTADKELFIRLSGANLNILDDIPTYIHMYVANS